ncbi:MAG: hypothetical protein ABIJ21_05425, partial [Nanoarchaeota archaeon]
TVLGRVTAEFESQDHPVVTVITITVASSYQDRDGGDTDVRIDGGPIGDRIALPPIENPPRETRFSFATGEKVFVAYHTEDGQRWVDDKATLATPDIAEMVSLGPLALTSPLFSRDREATRLLFGKSGAKSLVAYRTFDMTVFKTRDNDVTDPQYTSLPSEHRWLYWGKSLCSEKNRVGTLGDLIEETERRIEKK